MASETSVLDRRYLVLQYYEHITSYSQQVLCMKQASDYDQEIPQSHTADRPTRDVFGTLANYTVGICHFFGKRSCKSFWILAFECD